MNERKRCDGCPRPICQRIISVDDTCSNRKIPIQKLILPVEGEPLNEVMMPDSFPVGG